MAAILETANPEGAPPFSPAICERARLARDARFDGRFFIGVKTTGVYCRPVCPVRQPMSRNVRYFGSAAAAAEAGFRPCLRCRPEVAPGTPAWLGASAMVSRALRLVAEGRMDEGGVEEVASCVGVSPRHLHRLFLKHLGASPVAVAQTRRLHFAKRLLDETGLGMAQIAMGSGFGSIRRFNAAFRATYGRAPRELRRAGGERRAAGEPDGGLLFRLAYRPPFDWSVLLDFFSARATPGVESVQGGAYRRTIRYLGAAGTLEVTPAPGRNELLVRVRHPDLKGLFPIVERARRMFDLACIPSEIASHLARDPLLAPLVRAHRGLRLPVAWDGFELAVRAILGQQVTVKAATTMAGRLARIYGTPAGPESQEAPWLLFPAPEALADAEAGALRLPEARAAAIRNLARAAAEGRVRFDGAMDAEELRAAMTALPGIGEWTAQYVAMRALGDPDAFPASDLGLIRAMERLGQKASPRLLLERAERWRPWRAYAAMLLWKSLGAAQ